MVKKFSFNFPFFGFGIEKESKIVLKRGESLLIQEWSWKRFGYKKKIVTIESNGDVNVKEI